MRTDPKQNNPPLESSLTFLFCRELHRLCLRDSLANWKAEVTAAYALTCVQATVCSGDGPARSITADATMSGPLSCGSCSRSKT